MKAELRRKQILALLLTEGEAISGGELSRRLGASRQIIVSDIAALKAQGNEIISTHKGYIIKESALKERVFKLKHTGEQTEDELMSIVRLGGAVVDVFVWHKVYGKLRAPLGIFSELGVEQFLEGIKSGRSSELMHITSGYHYHTVSAESEQILDRIESCLNEKGYIVPEI